MQVLFSFVACMITVEMISTALLDHSRETEKVRRVVIGQASVRIELRSGRLVKLSGT